MGLPRARLRPRRGPRNGRLIRYHPHGWYHTLMEKTTVYLTPQLKAAIKRVAWQRRVTEAEVIRDSIRAAVGGERPRARGGLFASRAPIAREVDVHLKGFGER